MVNPLKSSPAKQSQKLAQQIAKQIAQEPVEIAKDALNQVTGLNSPDSLQKENTNIPNETNTGGSSDIQENIELIEEKNKIQGQRQMQALENELKEITQKKLIKKQQEEALINQQKIIDEENKKVSPLVEPNAKKTRNLFAGMGKPKKNTSLQAERQKTRVERVMPPTG